MRRAMNFPSVEIRKAQKEGVPFAVFFRQKDGMNYQHVRIHMDSYDSLTTHMYEADGDEADEALEHFPLKIPSATSFHCWDAAQEKAGKPLKVMLSPLVTANVHEDQ